jgi:hypothetical protein
VDPANESSIEAAIAEVYRILEGQVLDVLINYAGQYSMIIPMSFM